MLSHEFLFYRLVKEKERMFLKEAEAERLRRLCRRAKVRRPKFRSRLASEIDLYPDFSAEKMARLFAEDLCNGRIERISKDKNTILAPNYYGNFTREWTQKSEEFAYTQCDADDFILLEYHYKRRNTSDPGSCKVILRAVKIFNISRNVDEIKQCDYDFEIHLTKVAIPSPFMGKSMGWRISGFSYTKSKAYTMKEWLDTVKEEIRTKD